MNGDAFGFQEIFYIVLCIFVSVVFWELQKKSIASSSITLDAYLLAIHGLPQLLGHLQLMQLIVLFFSSFH